MPVVISLYNALTGLAVGLEGFVLNNAAMIIAGTVVGSAVLCSHAADGEGHEPLAWQRAVLGFAIPGAAATASQRQPQSPSRPATPAVMMAFAQKVIVVPVTAWRWRRPSTRVWELSQLLIERGVQVAVAIHPVAGRMRTDHMNVLLAEAGVPYDLISDLDR